VGTTALEAAAAAADLGEGGGVPGIAAQGSRRRWVGEAQPRGGRAGEERSQGEKAH